MQACGGEAVIYFVDEDCGALGAWISELRLRGYRTEEFTSARQAFLQLWNAAASEVELVVIDVMLDPGQTIPGAEPTLTEGLNLIRDLSDQNPAVFPSRAVLFTASVSETRRMATAFADEMGIELWDKSAICSPVEFGDRVQQAVAARSTGRTP